MSDTTTLRALIWVAVSSGKQAKDDKISLPEQEKRAQAIASERGWHVVEVLRVPGHSRNYIDIHECAADMQARGIDAFTRLLEHFALRDFDVLICYGSDRFARTQSLHAYIVETVITTCSARIFSMVDGEITRQNMRMFISMTGYKAASDMDRLRDFAAKDRLRRAENGKITTSRPAYSHRVLRDPVSGRDTGLALREELMPMWADLARLILDGVGYNRLGVELYRLGHARPDGRPLRSGTLFEALRTPMFWGHLALNYRAGNGSAVSDMDSRWVWDDSYPPPKGTLVFRDRVPAVYTGELAERVKAELTRRQGMKGRARPGASLRWSGLVRCAICGFSMGVCTNINRVPYVRGVRCDHAITRPLDMFPCPNRGIVTDATIKHYLEERLSEWLAGMPVTADNAAPVDNPDTEWILREVEQTSTRIERLVMEQSSAPESAQPIYRQQIAQLSEHLQLLRERANQVATFSTIATNTVSRQKNALEVIRDVGPANLWSLPDKDINQLLHALFGNLRLAGYRRRIIGIIDPAEFGGD